MKSKWLIAIAVASVALNLAFLGFIVGKEARPFPAIDPTRGYTRWVKNLPDDRQQTLLSILREGRQHPDRPRLRALHRNFRQALTTEPLDTDALATALDALRRGHHALQTESHETFIAFVGALTADERAALAADLAKPPRRHRLPRRERLTDADD